ncbi:type II toxin-antitoxin system PemK/MazF family toxin [Myxosarcina sp. GI1]|uniref:type II toxin-antitoxin system PemK/MazF family toxin n=1 Tax=Myxosarcina sp. GI1 TaxID=1541065 RepID=UPI000566C282|nr:type II toxin-antitoxin system PemK/MazF family toxin [Myxosarcina sp. GI1]
MVIKQGDIYWIDLGEPIGAQSAYRHPHVVIQNNVFNQSRIATVIVCALTSNLKRANAPGNILLEKDEANLPKQSIVNVSQIFTVSKEQLQQKIGTLSKVRIEQILAGIQLVIEPKDV